MLRFAACVLKNQPSLPKSNLRWPKLSLQAQRPRRARSKTSLSAMNGALLQLANGIASADAAPTSQQTAAAEKALGQNAALMKQWEGIKVQSASNQIDVR